MLKLIYPREEIHLANFQKKMESAWQENNFSDELQIHHLPLIASRDEIVLAQDLAFVQNSDWLIFTSPNAVRSALKQFKLAGQKIIAIGKKTAEALPCCDLIAPPPFNSEALLEIWQPKNKQISIIAAPGGRDLLHKNLSKNNHVKLIFTYQRYNPSAKFPAELQDANLICITSCSVLDNFMQICFGTELKKFMATINIVALSARVAKYSQECGFKKVFSTNIATEEALISAICACWRQEKGV